MYGLPRDVDLSFLEGQMLLQVCLGANEVILHFDEEVSIAIESPFSIKDNGKKMDTHKNVSEVASILVKFLHAKIKSVKGEENGTLTLYFDDGQILKIFDDSEQFESYTIDYKGETVIIV